MARAPSIMWQCRDCRRRMKGGPAQMVCERCGGELRRVKYGPTKRKGIR